MSGSHGSQIKQASKPVVSIALLSAFLSPPPPSNIIKYQRAERAGLIQWFKLQTSKAKKKSSDGTNEQVGLVGWLVGWLVGSLIRHLVLVVATNFVPSPSSSPNPLLVGQSLSGRGVSYHPIAHCRPWSSIIVLRGMWCG